MRRAPAKPGLPRCERNAAGLRNERMENADASPNTAPRARTQRFVEVGVVYRAPFLSFSFFDCSRSTCSPSFDYSRSTCSSYLRPLPIVHAERFSMSNRRATVVGRGESTERAMRNNDGEGYVVREYRNSCLHDSPCDSFRPRSSHPSWVPAREDQRSRRKTTRDQRDTRSIARH